MDYENKINAVIETAMKNLNNLIDVNTVVGKPIHTDGGTVFPISKVTMGFMTGGGEYGEVKLFKKDGALPFAGGSGAIISMKPAGFLVQENGKFKVVSVGDIGKLMDTATDIIDNLQQDN